MTTIPTKYGPIEFRPRAELPALAPWGKPGGLDPSRIKGITVHYAGAPIARHYSGVLTIAGDIALMKATVAEYRRRDGFTDVAYNLFLGRSGLLMEGRGLGAMNGANGPLAGSRAEREGWFPAGAKTSNGSYVSLFVCCGTDGKYATMTDEQMAAGHKVAWWLADLFRIPAFGQLGERQLCGHRDVRATQCPGDGVMKQLGVWRVRPEGAPGERPTLAVNSFGPWVRKLHDVLAGQGYALDRADVSEGVYGQRTKLVVEAMQKSNRLPIDGIVGPATWKVVDAYAAKAAAVTTAVTAAAPAAVTAAGTTAVKP